jgi:D-sedoheptulose 7-phosphate isomerase
MEKINDQLEAHNKLFSKIDAAILESAAHMAVDCFLNGGKLYICGSGMSAWLSGYTASLFMNKCIMSRPPLPAIALADDISYMSEDIFEKQIIALATPADLVWGLVATDIANASAESVVRALRAAAHHNVKNVGFFGKNSKNMQGICDISLSADHIDAVRVMEMHLAMVHIICDTVDNIIFRTDV